MSAPLLSTPDLALAGIAILIAGLVLLVWGLIERWRERRDAETDARMYAGMKEAARRGWLSTGHIPIRSDGNANTFKGCCSEHSSDDARQNYRARLARFNEDTQ